MFISDPVPDPDFIHPRSQILYPGAWISDPTRATKEEGTSVSSFFVITNLTELKIILLLNRYRKKFEPFAKGLEYFLPKILSKLLKIWVGIQDLGSDMYMGSRIRKKLIPDSGSRIPDPGIKKAPNPGS
jgi:hypothetical protein